MDNKLGIIKYPLVFFYNKIKNPLKITDANFRVLFVKVITLQQDYFLDLDLAPLFFEIKLTHPQTWKIVKVYQKVLKLNLANFEKMRNYKNNVANRIFNLSLANQILYWNKKLNYIKALDDASFGDSFSIKMLTHDKKNYIYENEIINRLIKVKSILGIKFFTKNNIILFLLNDFLNFTWTDKTKIYFKLIKTIKNKIIEIINLLKNTETYLNILNEIYHIVY